MFLLLSFSSSRVLPCKLWGLYWEALFKTTDESLLEGQEADCWSISRHCRRRQANLMLPLCIHSFIWESDRDFSVANWSVTWLEGIVPQKRKVHNHLLILMSFETWITFFLCGTQKELYQNAQIAPQARSQKQRFHKDCLWIMT